jgi:hypothetical protein
MSDEELIKSAEWVRSVFVGDDTSEGWCVVVSTAIQLSLREVGIEAVITRGNIAHVGETEHYWLTLPDGRIMDGTSDQFPEIEGGGMMPAIYLGRLPRGFIPSSPERFTVYPMRPWGDGLIIANDDLTFGVSCFCIYEWRCGEQVRYPKQFASRRSAEKWVSHICGEVAA